jgi:hypothetical protein
MRKEKKPLFSNDFLDELAEEISDLYGGPDQKQKEKENAFNLDEKNVGKPIVFHLICLICNRNKIAIFPIG